MWLRSLIKQVWGNCTLDPVASPGRPRGGLGHCVGFSSKSSVCPGLSWEAGKGSKAALGVTGPGVVPGDARGRCQPEFILHSSIKAAATCFNSRSQSRRGWLLSH